MKQTARIISTYSADVFGVASALFELGGMVVMHDASGCNSTYTTHDEPRWYDMDSMIYISALSEMEAIMGDDEKLVNDVAAAAEELHPKFIALAGSPISAMTGFDYEAVAALIEQRTAIPCLGFATTGMKTYIPGASMALEGIARRFVKRDVPKTETLSVNILGLTPLDFSTNGADRSIAAFLEHAGFEVISRWAMGSSLEELTEAGRARVNLVVSSAGLGAAKALQELCQIPYVIGVPFGSASYTAYQEVVKENLLKAVQTGENQICRSQKADEPVKKQALLSQEADKPVKKQVLLSQEAGESAQSQASVSCENRSFSHIAVIGEEVTALSLAQALEMAQKCKVTVLCDTECDFEILREHDIAAPDEEDLIEALEGMEIVIADPMYQPICPPNAVFIPVPNEACSGRLYRKQILNLITDLDWVLARMG